MIFEHICVELCEAVEQHDQQLIGRLLPVIKQRHDEATRALSDCLEVKDVAAHWYLSYYYMFSLTVHGVQCC